VAVRVGIIGLGYWGPNLLRNFRAASGCSVVAVADLDPARLAQHLRLHPDVRGVERAEDVIGDPDIDAVVLAVPAGVMPNLAVAAMEAGKHVMVEKPMAHSIDEGRRMLDAARSTGRVGMVDFTFVYSAPVRYMRSLIENNEIGGCHYYQSTRINLGRFQQDVDVIWDLAVHDVAILRSVLGRDPVTVTATGRGRGERADTAHVTLSYDDGMHAFVHVSWLAPIKVRSALLACDRGMVLYDDVEPDEKIRIHQLQGQFDPGTEDPLAPTFRLGDVRIPRLVHEEPLRRVAETFVQAVQSGQPPPTDWAFGVGVLSVLEAAKESLASGRTVEVPSVAGYP
jgi:predicted dehydrogenase